MGKLFFKGAETNSRKHRRHYGNHTQNRNGKAVLDAAKYIQKEASAEKGCVLFSLNTEKEAPHVVVLYEVFKDQAALNFHKKQPHTLHFLQMLEGKYTENKVTFLNTIKTSYHP